LPTLALGENFVAIIGSKVAVNFTFIGCAGIWQHCIPPSLSLSGGPKTPRKFEEEFHSRRSNPHIISFNKQSSVAMHIGWHNYSDTSTEIKIQNLSL
jgi:hypothetical protein